MSRTGLIPLITTALVALLLALPGTAGALSSELASAGAAESSVLSGAKKKKKQTVRKKVKVSVGQPGSVTLVRFVITVGKKKAKKKRSPSLVSQPAADRDLTAKKKAPQLPKPKLKIPKKALPAGASAVTGVWRHKKKKNKWVAIVSVNRPLQPAALASARTLSGPVQLIDLPINGTVTGKLPPGEFFTFNRSKPAVFIIDEFPTQPNPDACFENKAGKLTGPGFPILAPNHKRVVSFGEFPATPDPWTGRETSVWNVDAACNPSVNPKDYNDVFWTAPKQLPNCTIFFNFTNPTVGTINGDCDTETAQFVFDHPAGNQFTSASLDGQPCVVNGNVTCTRAPGAAPIIIDTTLANPGQPGFNFPFNVDGAPFQAAPHPFAGTAVRSIFDPFEDIIVLHADGGINGDVSVLPQVGNPIQAQFWNPSVAGGTPGNCVLTPAGHVTCTPQGVPTDAWVHVRFMSNPAGAGHTVFVNGSIVAVP